PPSFAMQLAVPILRDFRQASTEVDIDLISPAAAGPPLGDVDVAVIYSRPMVTDLVADLLWPVRLSILCHPQVAAQHAAKGLAGFIEANELVHVRIDELPRHEAWVQFVRHAGLGPINVERGLVFDTAMLAAQYALSGQGVALVDTNLFAEEIRSGRLVSPFDATVDNGYGYYLLTHPEGLADTAISLFRSWLIERFGASAPAANPPLQLAVSNDWEKVERQGS
ncbi:MAG: LysR family transcriptional regulator, partial [Gammaproteobacteria bacterium]|nr:LysR family transcriptional regulator [Gammaproteobacteria bacterium]